MVSRAQGSPPGIHTDGSERLKAFVSSAVWLGLVTLSFVFWLLHSFAVRNSIEAIRLLLTKHNAGF